MKKLLSFALILMVCCSSALLFGGCSSNNGTVTLPSSVSFEISEAEREDELKYVEALDRELAKITAIVVKDENGVTLFEGNGFEAKGKGASIQISLRENGTFTGKFSMYGITGEFTYTVNAGGGNGGSQTETHAGYVDLKNNQTQENGSDEKCDICGNAENEAAGSEHQQSL